MIDDRTGVIRSVFEYPVEPDAPLLFSYGSQLANTERFGVPEAGSLNGSTSIVRERALAGAIGEAVERYSARFVPKNALVMPLNELEELALDPRSLVLHSDDQYARPDFPYMRFDANVPVRWVQARSLTHNADLLVPAFAVFIPYVCAPQEPAFTEQTTNGLACGGTVEDATLSGLCEVVERHAVMSMWLKGKSPPHLDCTTMSDPVLAETLRRFERAGYEVDLLDVTGDIAIPVIVAAALDRSGRGPAATFASAAHLSGERAALGALEELAQCIPWLRRLRRERVSIPSPDEVVSHEDHVMWATEVDRLALVEFITSSAEIRGLAEYETSALAAGQPELAAAIRLLAQSEYEVIAVDVTPTDIEGVGLHVARVLVPGAQPLYFGRGRERVSGRVVASAGGATAQHLPGVRLPHPFP